MLKASSWPLLLALLTVAVFPDAATAQLTGTAGASPVPTPALTPIMLPLDPSVTPPPVTPSIQPPSAPSSPAAPDPARAPVPPSASAAPGPASPAPTPNLPAATEPPLLNTVPDESHVNLFTAGKLPEPRQMHGSAILGNRLYIIGGETFGVGWSTTVYSAAFDESGTLGEWRPERELPECRSYIMNSVKVFRNRIYIAGGLTPPGTQSEPDSALAARDILWTTVLADGSLAPWRKSAAFLPEKGLHNIAVAVTEKALYMAGGSYQGNASNAVYVADLTDEGAPENPRQLTTLPTPLWFHGAGVHDDRVYVWGGLKGSANVSVSPAVYSALLKDDGSLGNWEEDTPVPNAPYSAGYAVVSDHLLSVGGRYQGGVFMSDIWSAPFVAGQVGRWGRRFSNLETRVFHGIAADNETGLVFVTGGRLKTAQAEAGKFVDAVQALRVASPGAPMQP